MKQNMSLKKLFSPQYRRNVEKEESKFIAADELLPIKLVSEEVRHDIMMDDEEVEIEVVADYLLGQVSCGVLLLVAYGGYY